MASNQGKPDAYLIFIWQTQKKTFDKKSLLRKASSQIYITNTDNNYKKTKKKNLNETFVRWTISYIFLHFYSLLC